MKLAKVIGLAKGVIGQLPIESLGDSSFAGIALSVRLISAEFMGKFSSE